MNDPVFDRITTAAVESISDAELRQTYPKLTAELFELRQFLRAQFRNDQDQTLWLTTTHPSLGGKPLDLIKVGEHAQVREYLRHVTFSRRA